MSLVLNYLGSRYVKLQLYIFQYFLLVSAISHIVLITFYVLSCHPFIIIICSFPDFETVFSCILFILSKCLSHYYLFHVTKFLIFSCLIIISSMRQNYSFFLSHYYLFLVTIFLFFSVSQYNLIML